MEGIIDCSVTQHLGARALTNDANAAAVGEMMYGAAKGMKDFIMIWAPV